MKFENIKYRLTTVTFDNSLFTTTIGFNKWSYGLNFCGLENLISFQFLDLFLDFEIKKDLNFDFAFGLQYIFQGNLTFYFLNKQFTIR